jgi:hypothetical protein
MLLYHHNYYPTMLMLEERDGAAEAAIVEKNAH